MQPIVCCLRQRLGFCEKRLISIEKLFIRSLSPLTPQLAKNPHGRHGQLWISGRRRNNGDTNEELLHIYDPMIKRLW